MTTAQQAFISSIVGYIKKYVKEYGYHSSAIAAILAQAICESGWGKSTLASKYHNYFGMKCGSSWNGKSVNMQTKEEYTAGTLTSISANFRAYNSIEEGIKGYFDFIQYSRYANLKISTTTDMFIEWIKADGWATSSTYVKTLKSIVNTYGLLQYNTFEDTAEEITEQVAIDTVEYYPVPVGYTKNSIVDALKFIGVDSSLSHRKLIAAANGIDGYKGTAAQNKQMLTLLKAGKLVKEG